MNVINDSAELPMFCWKTKRVFRITFIFNHRWYRFPQMIVENNLSNQQNLREISPTLNNLLPID